MTRLSKLLIIWLGVLLVLTACSSSESGLTAENAEEKEEVVIDASTSSAQAVSTSTAESLTPTVQPPDSPTAQPTATQLPTKELVRADFPNLGTAPEIENEVWVNSDVPVTLASQRGKVVLVEFWTFG